MERETAKWIMWQEHEKLWTPVRTAADQDRHVIRVPNTSRLVWTQICKGNHTETRCDLGWADKHK